MKIPNTDYEIKLRFPYSLGGDRVWFEITKKGVKEKSYLVANRGSPIPFELHIPGLGIYLDRKDLTLEVLIQLLNLEALIQLLDLNGVIE